MKNKLQVINDLIIAKDFKEFWIDSINSGERTLTCSFKSNSFNENEELFIKFFDIDYLSLPFSWGGAKPRFIDVTKDYESIFNKLELDHETICDFDDDGNMYLKLINLSFLNNINFYILTNSISSWVEAYPSKEKIFIVPEEE